MHRSMSTTMRARSESQADAGNADYRSMIHFSWNSLEESFGRAR
jgi:hypothetical protein